VKSNYQFFINYSAVAEMSKGLSPASGLESKTK